MFPDFTAEEINSVMRDAWNAFHVYRRFSLKQRAAFMKAIAVELENCGDALIQTAMRETNLPEARLRGERARTIFQLNSYAEACEKAEWKQELTRPFPIKHRQNQTSARCWCPLDPWLYLAPAISPSPIQQPVATLPAPLLPVAR